MSALAAVHIKRRALGYEAQDDDWRDIVERVTGKRSTRDLMPKDLRALLTELDRLLGGKEAPSKGRRKPSIGGPYASKLQALWIGCWNLGLIAERDDKALIAFVKRQTGIDNPTWMLDAEDARKVIEAMKAMMARRGVRWSFTKLDRPFVTLPGYQIAQAQFRLVGLGAHNFGAWVQEQSGVAISDMDYADWVPIMNSLGRKVRAEVKAGRIKDVAA